MGINNLTHFLTCTGICTHVWNFTEKRGSLGVAKGKVSSKERENTSWKLFSASSNQNSTVT